jgi:hypothetical protein
MNFLVSMFFPRMHLSKHDAGYFFYIGGIADFILQLLSEAQFHSSTFKVTSFVPELCGLGSIYSVKVGGRNHLFRLLYTWDTP